MVARFELILRVKSFSRRMRKWDFHRARTPYFRRRDFCKFLAKMVKYNSLQRAGTLSMDCLALSGFVN